MSGNSLHLRILIVMNVYDDGSSTIFTELHTFFSVRASRYRRHSLAAARLIAWAFGSTEDPLLR
jgi:hypothetical protein